MGDVKNFLKEKKFVKILKNKKKKIEKFCDELIVCNNSLYKIVFLYLRAVQYKTTVDK